MLKTEIRIKCRIRKTLCIYAECGLVCPQYKSQPSCLSHTTKTYVDVLYSQNNLQQEAELEIEAEFEPIISNVSTPKGSLADVPKFLHPFCNFNMRLHILTSFKQVEIQIYIKHKQTMQQSEFCKVDLQEKLKDK